MKMTHLRFMIASAILFFAVNNASAQGLLGKLGSKLKGKSTETIDTAAVKQIDWNNIPTYTTQTVKVGVNADGTDDIRVFLVDQNGQRRSKEAVETQQKAIKKAFTKILKNVAVGAGVGAVTGVVGSGKLDASAAIGAGIGAVGGALLSADQIKLIKEHKKSLKQQEKLLETYKVSFTDEGKPVEADMDLSNINGIDFTKGTEVSMTATELKEELDSEGFKNIDTSVWDKI